MDKPIRIAHVFGKMDIGGAETFIMNVYRNIDRKKIQFDFIVLSGEDGYYDNEIKSMGGRVIKLNNTKNSHFISLIKGINYILKNNKDFYGIHSHVHYFSGYILLIARLYNKKLRISHSHTSETVYNLSFFKKIYIKIMKVLIELNSTHKLTCSNNATKSLYYNSSNVKFIPNAIDMSKYKKCNLDLKKELNINKKVKLIGHVGRFTSVKNHVFLIEVFKEIHKINSDTRLILVGDGELRNTIEKKIIDERLNKVVYLLGIRDDVNEILQNLDLFLFPSLYEGLPLTLVEAQACAIKSIVSSNIGKDFLYTNGLVYFENINSKFKWVNKSIKLLNDKNNFFKYKENLFNIDNAVEILKNIYFSKYEDLLYEN